MQATRAHAPVAREWKLLTKRASRSQDRDVRSASGFQDLVKPVLSDQVSVPAGSADRLGRSQAEARRESNSGETSSHFTESTALISKTPT